MAQRRRIESLAGERMESSSEISGPREGLGISTGMVSKLKKQGIEKGELKKSTRIELVGGEN